MAIKTSSIILFLLVHNIICQYGHNRTRYKYNRENSCNALPCSLVQCRTSYPIVSEIWFQFCMRTYRQVRMFLNVRLSIPSIWSVIFRRRSISLSIFRLIYSSIDMIFVTVSATGSEVSPDTTTSPCRIALMPMLALRCSNSWYLILISRSSCHS